MATTDTNSSNTTQKNGSTSAALAKDSSSASASATSSNKSSSTARENPLPLGAIALALGVAAGLAIPSTRMEDQWVGEYRDRAVDEAEELAQQALGNIESGAKKLVENAKSSDQHSA